MVPVPINKKSGRMFVYGALLFYLCSEVHLLNCSYTNNNTKSFLGLFSFCLSSTWNSTKHSSTVVSLSCTNKICISSSLTGVEQQLLLYSIFVYHFQWIHLISLFNELILDWYMNKHQANAPLSTHQGYHLCWVVLIKISLTLILEPVVVRIRMN